MTINSALLKFGARLAGDSPDPLLRYRYFFMLTLPFFVVGMIVILNLAPLSGEKRHRFSVYRRRFMMMAHRMM